MMRKRESGKHLDFSCWGGISPTEVYFMVKPWGSRYKGHWVQTEQRGRWWWGRKTCVWACLLAGIVHSQSDSAGTKWNCVCTLCNALLLLQSFHSWTKSGKTWLGAFFRCLLTWFRANDSLFCFTLNLFVLRQNLSLCQWPKCKVAPVECSHILFGKSPW